MLNAAIRYLVPLLALFAIGPVAGMLTGALRGHDGSGEASLLVCSAPMSGVLALFAVMGLAVLMGVIAARVISQRTGLFSAGLVLAWAAWGTGRVDLILTQPHKEGALTMLAIEGLLVGVLGVIGAAIILRVPTMHSALPEVRDPEHRHHHPAPEPTEYFDSTVPAAIGVAVAAAGVMVWLFAQETQKGQTFAASAIAGIAGAAGARVVAPRVSAVWVFAAVGILAAVSPLIASFVHAGTGQLVHAALAGKLFVLARVLPLDWVAGAFVGAPIGLVWAGSMVDRHMEPVAARR